MTEPGTLRVESLCVDAGSRRLLDAVSFDARPGEVIGVVGPNGAGKSTLLEVLVGLHLPAGGSISRGDQRLSRFADFAATFAFLPDGGELPFEATVATIVTDVLARPSRPPALTAQLRAVLGVEALWNEPAGVLSRGERQRVQLFCALAQHKPIVVLDEPFAVFDPLQLVGVLAVVKEVAAAGAIVVAAMHQLVDAEKLADRILILAGGRRVAWGSLALLREETGLPEASLEQIFVARLAEGKHAA
jgi:ABC-type multidrug transport system ATPase subunit